MARNLDSIPQNLVSIVVPCYRGARFLPEALESCLRQTHREIEVIVVDDASPDDCAAIAERYVRTDKRVRLIRRPQNGGVSRALNTGLEVARGRYLTRLAQDDVFGEHAVEVMLRHLQARPDAGLVYCDNYVIGEEGEVIERYCLPEPDDVLSFRNRLGLCVMWLREVTERVGCFDPRFDTAEDFEYWLRIAESFPITKCPDVAPFYVRAHGENGSTLFFERQVHATLDVVNSRFPTRSLRQRLAKRKALASAVFSASIGYSTICRRQIPALTRVLQSLALWPFPYRSGELPRPLARPKAIAVYTLRLIGLIGSY